MTLSRPRSRTTQSQQEVLSSFTAGKQKAAIQFAGSLVPKSRVGLVVRNQVPKVLGILAVASLVPARSLLDRLEPPHYPMPQGHCKRRIDLQLSCIEIAERITTRRGAALIASWLRAPDTDNRRLALSRSMLRKGGM